MRNCFTTFDHNAHYHTKTFLDSFIPAAFSSIISSFDRDIEYRIDYAEKAFVMADS